MPINFNKNVLLTGTGFTANFGGLLAREMWAKILNNKKIEQLPEVKKLLVKEFDFESIYGQVMRGVAFPPEQKELFQQIIVKSYKDMDDTLKDGCRASFAEYGIFWNKVSQFLTLFNGSSAEPGGHFTLNQDVMLERMGARIPLGITAVKYREFWDSLFNGQIDLSKPITLYEETGLQEFIREHLSSTGFPYYIKLHGSQGWLSANNTSQMVIGTNKFEDIKKEPLLNWYFQLFEEAIFRKDVKLFIVGYGFGDEHINSRIIKAIDEYKIRIYVISPEDPKKLKDRLYGKHEEDPSASYERSENYKIWKAISGYFPYRLRDIFPRGDVDSHIFKDIKRILT